MSVVAISRSSHLFQRRIARTGWPNLDHPHPRPGLRSDRGRGGERIGGKLKSIPGDSAMTRCSAPRMRPHRWRILPRRVCQPHFFRSCQLHRPSTEAVPELPACRQESRRAPEEVCTQTEIQDTRGDDENEMTEPTYHTVNRMRSDHNRPDPELLVEDIPDPDAPCESAFDRRGHPASHAAALRVHQLH